MKRIDINCDMGEMPEAIANGAQEAIMPFLSSVNIACGAHAGDEAAMIATIEQARRWNLAIGAHPGSTSSRRVRAPRFPTGRTPPRHSPESRPRREPSWDAPAAPSAHRRSRAHAPPAIRAPRAPLDCFGPPRPRRPASPTALQASGAAIRVCRVETRLDALPVTSGRCAWVDCRRNRLERQL